MAEYEYAIKNSYKEIGMKVSNRELVISGISKFDLFQLLNFSENLSFFISEQLYDRIKKEKITGFDGYELTAFKISG